MIFLYESFRKINLDSLFHDLLQMSNLQRGSQTCRKILYEKLIENFTFYSFHQIFNVKFYAGYDWHVGENRFGVYGRIYRHCGWFARRCASILDNRSSRNTRRDSRCLGQVWIEARACNVSRIQLLSSISSNNLGEVLTFLHFGEVVSLIFVVFWMIFIWFDETCSKIAHKFSFSSVQSTNFSTKACCSRVIDFVDVSISFKFHPQLQTWWSHTFHLAVQCSLVKGVPEQ